jgi:hypothetical protein
VISGIVVVVVGIVGIVVVVVGIVFVFVIVASFFVALARIARCPPAASTGDLPGPAPAIVPRWPHSQ